MRFPWRAAAVQRQSLVRRTRTQAAVRAARRAVAAAIAATAVYAPGLLVAQTAGTQSASAVVGQASAVAGVYSGPTWVSFRSPKFEIPFSVDAIGTQPVEVQLLVSRDGGTRWEMFARQPAGSRQFPFQATADGDYWFATRTIDAAGAAHPPGPVAPQLRVTVDRTNPQIEAHADADGSGQIVVDYRITDAGLQADALRLEYMTDAVRQWMPVQNVAQPVHRHQQGMVEGRLVWTPQSDWRHVSVCLIARDRAGNQTVLTRQVEKPRVASQVPTQLASTPLTPPALAADPPSAVSGLLMPADNAAADNQLASADPQNRGTLEPGTLEPGSFGAPEPRNIAVPEGAGRRGYAPTAWGTPVRTDAGVSEDRYASAADGYVASQMVDPRLAAAPIAGEMRGFATHPAPSGAARWPAAAGGFAMPAANPVIADAAVANAPGMATAEGGLDLSGPTVAAPGLDQHGDPQAARRSAAAAMRPLPFEELPAPLPTPLASDAAADQADVPQSEQQVLTVRTLPDTPAAPPAADTPAASAPQLSRSAIAQLGSVRQTNSHKFSLDYEVEAVGSGGLNAVELWATKDEGQTWEPWGKDPDGESPFDIETVGQGVYGFKMVVIGGNGLTSPRPMPGDPADLYVLVDTQQPTAKITGAQYGEQEETGQLIIRYRCDDANDNLTDRPVTLLFAAAPDGPWTTIATGLDNGGRYAWPADPQLPRQIYLRVEAVDMAGNVGGYTLDTPVNVQGLAPRARIRGFNPVAENTPSSAPPSARFK